MGFSPRLSNIMCQIVKKDCFRPRRGVAFLRELGKRRRMEKLEDSNTWYLLFSWFF